MTNVLEYLECSAERTPGKTAVIDPNGLCTYSELMYRSKCIGTALLPFSVPRSPVAVYMEKSIQALTALLGTIYAGCFYIFINQDQPTRRINQILDVSRAGCIITDNPSRISELNYSGTVLNYASAAKTVPGSGGLAAIRAQALDTDPLYCNFTSGSTGVPKGVLVSHRSVIDFMNYFPSMFGITGNDVIGNQAPFDFDVSVKDIYSSLKLGAELVLIPRKYFSIVTQLMDYICDNRVSTLIWASSALCLTAQFKGLQYRVPTSVNKILFSGEMMPVKYLHLWQSCLPDALYVNLYGPTEVTCNCTYYRIEKNFGLGEQIPIGSAFPNEKVFLLDAADQPVATPGIPGEICVSGTALALGYYNDPEQTAKVFVRNPLNTGYPEIICRTGDLAYYNSDGELCFSGRKDFQIKYRGHRIELEEIERAMSSLSEVDRGCCGFNESENRIVAFYCGKIEPMQLKKALYSILPTYMIPAKFHRLSALPLTANGKTDRKQLMEKEGSMK